MGMSSESGSVASALEAMAGEFQELLRSMMGDQDGLQLEAVIRSATEAIPSADHAAISLVRAGQKPETLFSTGELPIRVDAIQYNLHEGPCVSALTQNDFVLVNDLSTDQEFPRFAPEAVKLGVRSMLSTRLFLSQSNRAALNLYSDAVDAFRPEQLPVAAIFASYLSLLLLNRLHEDKIMNLERALESNREIGVAMGILMARGLHTQADAFEQLVKASQHLNRRLRDVANDVAITGELPQPPRNRG